MKPDGFDCGYVVVFLGLLSCPLQETTPNADAMKLNTNDRPDVMRAYECDAVFKQVAILFDCGR